MSYNYYHEKERLTSWDGLDMFVKIRDRAKSLLKTAGCFRMDSVLSVSSGDVWQMMACVDRMVELGEIIEVTTSDKVAGQHRIFTNYHR